MFFVHLRDLSFIWPFREANTRTYLFLNNATPFVEYCLFVVLVLIPVFKYLTSSSCVYDIYLYGDIL